MNTLLSARSPRVRTSFFAALALSFAGLVSLTGCVQNSPEAELEAHQETATSGARQDCDGIYVVADFGELESKTVGSCVDTEASMVAVDAFIEAGIELTEGDAFPGSICRVQGLPDANTTLEYSGEERVEDCSTMGPMWAYWGLFIESASGDTWEYAQEGVMTQQLQPGQAVAMVWQFGDTSNPRFPEL